VNYAIGSKLKRLLTVTIKKRIIKVKKMNPIEKNAYKILSVLIENDMDQASAKKIQKLSELDPDDVNDAAWYLEDIGAVELLKGIGSTPFKFTHLMMKSRGKYIYNDILTDKKTKSEKQKKENMPSRPLNPVGSPYGFTEEDWINIAIQRDNTKKLFVVFGLQFKSKFYNPDKLIENIKKYFQESVNKYNSENKDKITLVFQKLEAEYGSHLFNSIASKIIGSDISIFESSDLNANVMIELGVALTWGIYVLPLREKNSSKPPSDISGQTWIKYEKSGEKILDQNFQRKIDKIVNRAIAKKGR